MPEPVRLLIADDHALFREGLVELIRRWSDFEVVGTAQNGHEAVQLAAKLQPDLILMDVRMEPMGGVEAAGIICRADSRVRVVMLTMSNLGEDMFEALRNGAHGYIGKEEPADRLHDHLRSVMQGQTAFSSAIAAQVIAEFAGVPEDTESAGPSLTRREREVLRLVVDGLSNEEIANELHFSEASVKKHLGRIMSKLHMRNRVQVAVFGVRSGLAQPTQPEGVADRLP